MIFSESKRNQISNLSFKDLKYDGLILTTIELTPEDTPEDTKKNGEEFVSFTNKSKNTETSEAAFLKNITFVAGTFGGKYMATKVSKEKAAEIAREGYGDKDKDGKPAHTTLFSVHGSGGDPGTLLLISLLGRELFSISKKYYVIPVIWPTEGVKLSPFSLETWKLAPDLLRVLLTRSGIWDNDKVEQKAIKKLGERGAAQLLGYDVDWHEFAPKAGGILRELTNTIKNGSFGEVSLMCHSMGNHVVFNSAGQLVCGNAKKDGNAGVKFQDIFLVGADVKNDIFSENPSGNSLKKEDEIENQARGMKAMLAEKGKIYVLHTEQDLLLEGSPYAFKCRTKQPRLGFTGAEDIAEEYSNIVRNIDVTKNVDRFTIDFAAKHGYLYDPWAMTFYNDVHAHRENEDYIPEKYMSQVATCKTN